MELLGDIVKATARHVPWMGWNTFLALIPLALALVLFRPGRRRGPLWWAGAAAWLAFLPNAPYVLTDVVHLPNAIRRVDDDLVIVLGIVPQFGAFFLVGFVAYVASLARVERLLRLEGRGRLIVPVVLTLHLLAATGLYLGRVQRANSWDIVAAPHHLATTFLENLGGRFPLAFIAFSFVVLSVSYAAVRAGSLLLAGLLTGRSAPPAPPAPRRAGPTGRTAAA